MILNPTLIIEVLSDSTEGFDRGEKFRRYHLWLPSLTDYVLVSQHKPVIEHYRRLDAGCWEWVSVEGLEASLPLASIECVLPLAEVYDRVTFPPEEEMIDPDAAERE